MKTPHLHRFARHIQKKTLVALVACATALALVSADGAALGTNLIVNGDAEASPGSANAVQPPAGWQVTSNFTVVPYNSTPSNQVSGPNVGTLGANFFAGGPNNVLSSATQTIDVADQAALIDANSLYAALEGLFGGTGTQDDYMEMRAEYLDASQAPLATSTIGQVLANDRQATSFGLVRRATFRLLPVGTRAIRVVLAANRTSGADTYNDGYADNVSLQLINDTQTLTVLGSASPYLARVPSGVTVACDTAPGFAPQIVSPPEALVSRPNAQETFYFYATGGTNSSGATPSSSPDGAGFIVQPPARGIAGVTYPINSLVGVFMNDAALSEGSTPPPAMDFSPGGNVPGGVDYTELAPQLRQVFFIGDGFTSSGAAQRVIAPAGATHLYLASADACGWGDNSGLFQVTVAKNPIAAPVITSPRVATATVGQLFTYQFETAGPTARDVGALPPGLTFNPSLSAIVGVPQAAGTFQVQLSATNNLGTATATLSIDVDSPPSSGPVIISGTSVTGRTLAPFTLQVITTGGTADVRLSATGLPPGLSADPITGLITGTPTQDGSYAVDLTIVENGVLSTSGILQLTFTSDPARPVITSPREATITPGTSFSYTITAPNSDPDDPITYTLLGELPQGLSFDPASGTISGTYTSAARRRSAAEPPDVRPLTGGVISNVQIFTTNSHGTGTTPLVFFLAPRGVVNIATRLAIGTGQNVLIGGFIVTGNAPKKLIIRAIAPSLGLGAALQDPTLELRAGETLLASNDDWRSAQEQEILATTIPPPDNRESAVVAILQPGAYTAVVAGKNGSTGIGLVEVYDLGTASLESTSSAKLANLSTRGFVQTGDDVMIGGFIVSGESTRVIVRAVGPSLGNAGVAGAVQDTTLDFVDGSGSLVASNDDWRTGGQEQQIIETTVPPDDNRESAVVATLSAGGYTAVVRGKNSMTGVALVEVYVLQ